MGIFGSYKKKLFLYTLLISAILFPAISLAILAYRGLEHEDAYISKSLESAFSFTMNEQIGRISDTIAKTEEELAIVFGENREPDLAVRFELISKSSRLVDVGFFVSRKNSVLWPRKQPGIPPKDALFLKLNSDFLENRITIPIYRNVAVMYQEDILSNQGMIDKDAGAEDKIASQTEETSITQQAINEFESSLDIRNKVYEQAVEKGQTTNKRIAKYLEGQSKKEDRSIFVAESLAFAKAIEGRERGIIPRFADSSLNLLFWTRSDSGGIAGCRINIDELKQRLAAAVEANANPLAYFALIDETGNPASERDRPVISGLKAAFLSNEVSEILPGWELAGYLLDPGIVTMRVNTNRTVLWSLIASFIGVLAVSSLVLLKMLAAELKAARQKTSFVANVSHELKTPLTSIRIFAEMLRDRKIKEEKKRLGYFDLILSEVDRLSRLVGTVLDFSRMDRGKREYKIERTDIAALAAGVCDCERERLASGGFTLSFITGETPIMAWADVEAIKQALLNLLSNAEKYSLYAKEIKIEAVRKDGFACLHVSDRGIGVQHKHVKKIFTPFFRADDSLTARVSGTGLGLSIARKIVAGCGGALVYSPVPGGGSRFTIKLRLASSGPEMQTEPGDGK